MLELSQFTYLRALQRKKGPSFPTSVLADATEESFFLCCCVSLFCGRPLEDIQLVYNYFTDALDILHEVTIFSYLSMVRYDP